MLRQAFGHAEYVRVGGRGIMSGQQIRAEHLAGEDRECLNNYLAALLSSPHLQRIDLSAYSFRLNPGQGLSMWKRLYPIGPVFKNGPSYEHLTTLDIRGVSFREDELLEFLQRIGGTEFREVNLFDVGLESGDWKAALDLLRRLLPSNELIRWTSVSLRGGRGGGSDMARRQSSQSDDDLGSEASTGSPSTPDGVSLAATEYITHQTSTNPMDKREPVEEEAQGPVEDETQRKETSTTGSVLESEGMELPN
jgi:hypothetical protein